MGMFKQTGALKPNEFLSQALLKSAEIQEGGVAANDNTTVAQEEVPVVEKVETAAVEAVVAAESNATETNVTAINANADPLANPNRKSLFKNIGAKKEIDLTTANTATEASQVIKTEVKANTQAEVKPEATQAETTKPEAIKSALSTKTIAESKRSPTLADVAKKSQEGKREGFDAKIMMNTFKVFEPAISAAIFALGETNGPKAEKSIKVILDHSEVLKNQLCKIIGVDPLDPDKQWVVANIRLTAMTHVSAAFKRNPDPDTFTCDNFIEAFESVQNLFSVEPESNDFPDMTDSLRVKLSLMKSLNPVIKEYGLFENVIAGMIPGFKIDRAAIFDHASSMIQENSKDLVALAGVERDDKGMLISYQLMLNLSGTVMSNCIAFACDRMLEHLDTLKTDQRKLYVDGQVSAGNPAVIDLQILETTFSETMVALSNIVKAAPMIYATKVAPRP